MCWVTYARSKSFLSFSTPICQCLINNSYDVAHSIGVQNVVLPIFCLQKPIYKVLVIIFVLKLGVNVRLDKSELILSFYLSKQLKESSRTQIFGGKTSVTL